MAEELGGLKIKIGLEGSEFQQGIQGINREMKVLESAFKNQGAGIKDFGSSLDGLKAKTTLLNGQIDLQKQKHEALKEALEKSIEATGRYSKNSQNLQTQVNNAERSIKTLESQLKSTNKEIDLQSSKWTSLSKTMKSTSDSLKPIGEGFKNIGTELTLGLTAPIIAAGGASFKMASDMVESVNKVDTVFGENSKVVQDWADTSLDKMGMAKASALEMSSLFGDMGSGMGVSSQDNLKYSMSLTQLSADLASFKNVKVDIAKTALSGIYTGETESLKGLGIIMTETNLQEYALSQGIKTKVSEMSQAEKVALRYNYVMSVSKNSIGDFAKTSQSSSNQIKIFQESMKELGTTIGQNLIPVITPLIAKLNEWAKSFSKLSPETQKTILVVAGIAAALGPVLVVIGTLITAVSSITAAFATASAGIAAAGGIIAVLTGPIGIAIAAVVALVAVGVLLYKNWDVVKAKCSELFENIKPTWEAIKKTITDSIKAVVDFVKPQLDKIMKFWDENGKQIMDLLKAYWNILTTVFGTYFKVLIEVFKIAWNSISTVIKIAWELIKGYISIGIDLVTGIIKTALQILKGDWSGAWETIKTTVSNIMGDIVKVFKGINLVQIGKDMIQGLINGITSMFNAVTDASKKIASSAGDAIKKVLGIQSPSKVTTEYGKNVSEGFANGIETNGELVKKAAEEVADAAKKAFDFSKSWLDDRKYYNELSLQEELEGWQRIQARYIEGTDERKQADREVYRMQQELAKDRESANNEAFRVKKELTEKLKGLEDDYYKKVSEVNSKLREDVKKLNDDYEKTLSDRNKTLYNSSGLFDEIKPQEVTGKQLSDNLKTQVESFTEWQQNITELSQKGIDEGLVQELRDMGPKSVNQIQALNTLSSDELKEYVSMWRRKHEQAKEQSISELEGLKNETNKKIAELTVSSSKELEKYKATWTTQISELTTTAKNQLNSMAANGLNTGVNLISNLIIGIDAMKNPLQAKMTEINKMISQVVNGFSSTTGSSSNFSGALQASKSSSVSNVIKTIAPSISVPITVAGNIIGSNGMKELSSMVSQAISGKYGLTTGGAF